MTTPVRLDEARRAFVEGPVTIVVASRNDAHQPVLALAFGCRIAANQARIRAFIVASHCPALLDSIRESGTVAVSFAEPGTHKTIQLKGANAKLEPADAADREKFASHLERYARALMQLGRNEAFTGAVLPFAATDLMTVTFTPTAAFSQTPGPRAGDPLQP